MALVDRLEMIKLRLNLVTPVHMLPDHMNLEQRVTALVHNIQHSKSRYIVYTSLLYDIHYSQSILYTRFIV